MKALTLTGGGYRGYLGVLVVVMLAAAPAAAQQQAAADSARKFIGNIWSPRQVENFERHWNQVTPENAGKWGPMAPTRDSINWAPLDAAYKLAKDNGYIFRFHTLIWGNQQPEWMADLTPEEQLAEVRKRFTSIAARYPEMDYVEVVNEPLHDPPRMRNENDRASGNYYEALGGAGSTGWDWVLTAFRMAREEFPDTKLVLNDFNITNSDEATTRYIELIRLLQAENLIDVIGIQGHAFTTTADSAVTRANLNRLAETGLPIMVTEMDIDGPTDDVQLAEMRKNFPIFWDHPSVIGVTLWGWRPGLWRQRQGANLVREDGTYRPALDWLLNYVDNDR